MDMMENSSIVYHPESLIEMQMLCATLFTFYYHSGDIDGEEVESKNMVLFICVCIHHVFSYFSSMFRSWEISKYGQPDINAVLRAKCETYMSTIEVLFSSVIVGYILNYLISLDDKNFHD
mgnify:CR=1 FL=1